MRSHPSLNAHVDDDAGEPRKGRVAEGFAMFVGATAYSLVLRGLGGDQLIERAFLALPFRPSTRRA